MDAIKVEQNSDSETQSVSSKDDFEFVEVKYEQDPLEPFYAHDVSKTEVRWITLVLCCNFICYYFTQFL